GAQQIEANVAGDGRLVPLADGSDLAGVRLARVITQGDAAQLPVVAVERDDLSAWFGHLL
ncbi:MAG: hypothetical protein DRN07_04035, partial [Thermoplasmata archaeon]